MNKYTRTNHSVKLFLMPIVYNLEIRTRQWIKVWENVPDLVMETPLPLAMCRGWRLMAFKTLQLFDFFGFYRRRLITNNGRIVFRGLERLAATLIGHVGNLIGDLPVRADGYGMALVTAAWWRNTFPSREHGTPFKPHKNSKQNQHG